MSTVSAYLEELSHSRRDEISRLRLAILEAEPTLTESIKWNAPNFLVHGEDRVTFRIHPDPAFQVILHRGAAPAQVETRVDAPPGLVRWASSDRGILTAPDSGFDAWVALALPVIVAWTRAQ